MGLVWGMLLETATGGNSGCWWSVGYQGAGGWDWPWDDTSKGWVWGLKTGIESPGLSNRSLFKTAMGDNEGSW
jgi:hypothetical protein